MTYNIYLAGKFSVLENPWRDIFIRDNIKSDEEEVCKVASNFYNIDIIGPFSIDHNHISSYRHIIQRCNYLISLSDVFFAWIDKEPTYGTYVEIGIAYSLKIPILIGTNLSKEEQKEMAFIFDCANYVIIDNSPFDACKISLIKLGFICQEGFEEQLKKIENVIRNIKRLKKLKINEENTKASLIEPILTILGWDIYNPEEVIREFRTSNKGVVDYKLNFKKQSLYLEVKPLNMCLDDYYVQILTYCFHDNISIGILSNGDKYIFLDIISKKCFLSIQLSELNFEDNIRNSLLKIYRFRNILEKNGEKKSYKKDNETNEYG